MAICLWLLGAGVTMYGLSSAAWSSFGNMSLAAWRGMAINLSWLLGAGVTMYGLSSVTRNSGGNLSLAALGSDDNLSLGAWSNDGNLSSATWRRSDYVWPVFSCLEQ